MTTLTRASRQWAERPADERFGSLEALHQDATRAKELARQSKAVETRTLQVLTEGGDLVLNGSTGARAGFTNWSFGQLCRRVEAPADYIRELPGELAAECLNHGLKAQDQNQESRLLLEDATRTSDADGVVQGYTLRALTSPSYTRIFDADITARLLRLEERGPWQPAPAAFDGSRGLYRGDRDMFCFLVDSGRRIFEKAPGGGLSRGFFAWNSEVGSASFGIATFLYEYVCGNHMVWGASNLKELRIRHVGDADSRAWGALAGELRAYAEGSADEDEAKIQRAHTVLLGKDKEEVLDRVFGLRLSGLSQGAAADAFKLAEAHSDWYGDPKSVWGFANGLTELARDQGNADKRVAMDRAAGKVLEVAF